MRLSNRLSTIGLMTTVLSLAALDGAVGQVGANQGFVNPNLAGKQELTALPGLDEPAVDALLAARPFLTMSDLHAVLSKHVAEDAFDGLYRRLFVPIDLNSASREEILLVPGVGARMAHEFEEYRPYRAMAQFRREMGKYVDDEEVARLEQFVFVPIDLNTASDEDIQSIPGVGSRMLREFKEYRPYTSMAQFRREIGKYVDDKELARLERYVTIR
jgi:DNA uptake protein ComE-like DNA-binding protein